MQMSFYTGKVGASAQQTKMDVTANNIANIGTAGYKAKSLCFSDLVYNNMAGRDGAESDVKCGSGAKPDKTNTSFEKGSVNPGSQLDFSIEGRGFFGLQNPQTKEKYYTTSGNFVLAEKGDSFYLASKEGYFVLNRDGNPIKIRSTNGPVTDEAIELGKDGSPLEGEAVALEDAQPAVFDFFRTDGMLSVGDSNFIPVEKNGAPFLSDANVTRGSFEGSNVDISKEFTKVIEAQRAYQYSLRMVQTTDEIQNLINNLR
ncbi:flagellar hook-basal body protein [Anaerotignum sp. MB30-C6]|uniref:flagellar hook-basal body protein n=1 Tax=Anaerotignum sp. MB30-C6 TaxID=3070814 RepID=UPI0027DCF9B0|nr:flagellar hook-basal body protein [Anaerotignum sp. MB30-C6]WMI80966.1 flagellar hook-basal body protein [Anaerotignum sp. MB30-C6]